MKATARANTNIALIKYWGKKDEALNLPLQSSISMTVDKFFTDTTVTYKEQLMEDQLYIDDKFISGDEKARVVRFMDFVRKEYNIPFYAEIVSYNYVPKKAGVASSSSAFASLALAASKAYNLNLSEKELSSLARFGSGSAARSIYNDLAIWHEGDSHETSYAERFAQADDLALLVCMIDPSEKKIDSRTGMKALDALPELKAYWKEESKRMLEAFIEAFDQGDINRYGLIVELNALLMHTVMKDSGIIYLQEKSMKIIELTGLLRQQGFPVFATMDAGPNVKILTKKDQVKYVLPIYEQYASVIVCHKGEGVKLK